MIAANLARYQAVVFNNISSKVVAALPQASQRTALMNYVKTGGFIGIHAVSEDNYWPDLVSNLGSKMANPTSETNPATATLKVDPQSASHPITWVRALPGGGRIDHTGIGHFGNYLNAAYSRALFLNAVYWAAGGRFHGRAARFRRRGNPSIPGRPHWTRTHRYPDL